MIQYAALKGTRGFLKRKERKKTMSNYIGTCDKQYRGEARFSKSAGYHHSSGYEKSWIERVMSKEELMKSLLLIPCEHRKSAFFWLKRKDNSPKKMYYMEMIEKAKKCRRWVDTPQQSMV